MQLYQFNFRQKYFVVTFLLLVFVVGCVSIKQEESNQGFMVSMVRCVSWLATGTVMLFTYLD